MVKNISPLMESTITGEYGVMLKKYNILNNFFNEYNKQIASYQFGGEHPAGYCGVMELFIHLIKDRKTLMEFFTEPDKYRYDPIIRWFFDRLKSELLGQICLKSRHND